MASTAIALPARPAASSALSGHAQPGRGDCALGAAIGAEGGAEVVGVVARKLRNGLRQPLAPLRSLAGQQREVVLHLDHAESLSRQGETQITFGNDKPKDKGDKLIQ
jgi:hypothetical protein